MHIQDHPMMKKILADVAEANVKQEQERIDSQMETARLRQEQGQMLNKQFLAAMADYEAERIRLHEVVGRMFAASQAYSRVTGVNPPTFPEVVFNRINLPTLKPGSHWDIGTSFSTTQAAVMNWFSNMGKWS